MFRAFWIDVILGTLFIFGLMGLFASITTFKIFDVFDPIGDALADMETTLQNMKRPLVCHLM